jgi:hypothetical protein
MVECSPKGKYFIHVEPKESGDDSQVYLECAKIGK